MEFWSRVSLESFEKWGQNSGQCRQRHGRETREVNNANGIRERLNSRGVLRVIEAKRLEHTLHPMAQVRTKQPHRDQVGSRNPPNTKTKHHVGVDVGFRELGVGRAYRQMQEAEMRKLIELLRSGANGQTLARVHFLGVSRA